MKSVYSREFLMWTVEKCRKRADTDLLLWSHKSLRKNVVSFPHNICVTVIFTLCWSFLTNVRKEYLQLIFIIACLQQDVCLKHCQLQIRVIKFFLRSMWEEMTRLEKYLHNLLVECFEAPKYIMFFSVSNSLELLWACLDKEIQKIPKCGSWRIRFAWYYFWKSSAWKRFLGMKLAIFRVRCLLVNP